jgi:DNA topoisomerase-1
MAKKKKTTTKKKSTTTKKKSTTTKKKSTTTKKKSTKKAAGSRTPRSENATGKQLVIVESPAKAKTINKYLGPGYVVRASVGHVRDLPPRAPKGVKMPVPGVDLDNNFEPSYEILADKKKTVAELKKLAKQADTIWFATDLDREGEAIAWHLAQIVGVKPSEAKRVIFNAITRKEIQRAFETPHVIDEYKVNAQQARRILDRIVGYQASPLLWKKVARGLSAGRVQSVAVRIVVEREREIDVFVPDESWSVEALLALDPKKAGTLTGSWGDFITTTDAKGKGPTIKVQNAWLAEHGGLKTELVELGGTRFNLGCSAESPVDLSAEITEVAEAVGMKKISVDTTEKERGKGPARFQRTLQGELDPKTRYAVKSTETKRTTSRAYAPFITSTLQQNAANRLGFATDRTMRLAQGLYEGIEIKGEGQVGLITYMRTDSTTLSGEAISNARNYIEKTFGTDYLPEKPNFFGSSNKAAQEAHEAIRPTEAHRTPDSVRSGLKEDQYKLYKLIWERYVSCQMTPAKFDATTVLFERSDEATGAILKTNGRVLVFDGFMRVAGVPTASDEQTLPSFKDGQETAPFSITPKQKFTSPPPRYNEGSLVKKLEEEGIGRPSTYASIIRVIQDRGYVEQVDRRFHATAMGEVVTDMLVEAFPVLMQVSYTKDLEERLDLIESDHRDWREMLGDFYGRFSTSLAHAHENLMHARAVTRPAPYACPECGATTSYRFGKNGRFLSCSTYPECDYAAPVDREGQPLLPEQVDIKCPEDQAQMIKRTGRFGPFIASPNYPETQFVLNIDKKGGLKLPSPPPYETELTCPKCEERPMYLREGARGPWLGCSGFPKCRGRMGWAKLEEDERKTLELALKNHLKKHPMPVITRMDDTPIEAGTPVSELLVPGGVAVLTLHPDAGKEDKVSSAAG